MEKNDDQFEEFFQGLPKNNVTGYVLAQYKGFWFDAPLLQGTLTFRQHFQQQDSDIILATMPKSGTTWLKALVFSIVNRKTYPDLNNHPLLFHNPHRLVPFFEINLYKNGQIPDQDHINAIPSPRIFATHIPYQCLPNTILEANNNSSCRIIYLCRNPLDAFTAMMHFVLRNGLLPQDGHDHQSAMSLDVPFKSFCDGTYQYGPFWDHVLEYWEASIKDPIKVMFLKFEDLKKDINSSVKKIAEHLGCAFSPEEENGGLVEEISKLCSIDNLKNLECNQKGETETVHKAAHNSFFRKGEVGDWANFLTPPMAERLERLMKEKFAESGVTLNIHG
ncbi:OLC1v1030969C1 [Oldenlandia corymbosa var. corymbosa]|uniref:Sulfotransferase n=1 Tax=Oldenlandia corymbosa var. corymbosa TaxID=529605 RepID=A0AAV1CJ96_OLDCO|nr:OLC1v1030969C1 [Oldenlandia corymbosa var. corymbosa]